MPHRHPAYPEEARKLQENCDEMTRRLQQREEQETDNYTAAVYGVSDIHNLRAALDSPYFMRLRLKYENGSVKDVCFGENARDIPLKDAYICGIGSPLRQQIQHRTAREVSIHTASGRVRTNYQQLRRQLLPMLRFPSDYRSDCKTEIQ